MTGADAAAIGERFGDADLFALAAQDLGNLHTKLGRVQERLALLDEAMVAGELSPIVNGFVYCGVIMGCQAAHEPRRAHEWTAALTRWCDAQPDMVSFTGTCLVRLRPIYRDTIAARTPGSVIGRPPGAALLQGWMRNAAPFLPRRLIAFYIAGP